MPSDLKWGLLGGLIVLVVGALALGCGVMLEGRDGVPDRADVVPTSQRVHEDVVEIPLVPVSAPPVVLVASGTSVVAEPVPVDVTPVSHTPPVSAPEPDPVADPEPVVPEPEPEAYYEDVSEWVDDYVDEAYPEPLDPIATGLATDEASVVAACDAAVPCQAGSGTVTNADGEVIVEYPNGTVCWVDPTGDMYVDGE